MLFPTVTFALFFLVVLAGYWLLAPHGVGRKLLLLAAAVVFYGHWDRRFVGLLAVFVVVNWAAARAIRAVGRGWVRTALTTAGIVADVGVLSFFKYYGFFVDSLTEALSRFGLAVHPPLLDVLLPVGISFYTFEAVAYLVQVHRGRTEPGALLDVAVWLSFFPKLMSGPITRAEEFLPQLAGPPDTAHVQSGRAYWLIGRGLVKKLVVASFLATAVTDDVFADPHAYGSAVLLVGAYAFAAQIYADFSGYTDMAIGLSLLLGFRLPENFDRPYTATSVQDFWSRWHMTLSRWLRDFLFAPFLRLAGGHPWRRYGAIVAVMLLAGLWHGAAWTFVAFGAVHGVAMALERTSRERRRAYGRPPARRTVWRQVLRRVVTFHVVCLGWVFFAAGSVGDAGTYLHSLATNWSGPSGLLTPLLLLTVLAVVAAQYVPAGATQWVTQRVARASAPVLAAGFAGALVVIAALAPTTVPAFLYFRF